MKSNVIITHQPEKDRFIATLDDAEIGELNYYLRDGVVTYTHTGVRPQYEGRGIGAKLVKAGLDFAQAEDYKVVPLCWFVGKYIRRKPEYQPLLHTS